METPLLALTRRRAGAAPDLATPVAATDNMRQLVQLRWLAVAGQLLTIVAVDKWLGVPLPLAPMLGIVALLAAANLVGTLVLPRRRVTNPEILLALLLDVGALTAQLFLSGGSTNPFISLYLLQVVLGAILLEMWSAWILVLITSLCFAGLSLRSVPLVYPVELLPDVADLHTIGSWISFALTGVLLGLFVTRITRNLRARDRYLADLRQHAVEEDAIVRMGLFASGAAHELGTPLATLSVILGDWGRMPRVTGDPELAGELAEMQAEVGRCKVIVTDILHSAGQPRGEAMDSVETETFLRDLAAAWRPTHPDVRLEEDIDVGDGTIPASTSVRQAVWNLLDNAAEASPSGIRLHAARAGDDVAIVVADAGPGFDPEHLADLGKPCQSDKGAGHGLGLFLAATVARRLGGRLDARNLPEGGAQVELTIPFSSAPDQQR